MACCLDTLPVEWLSCLERRDAKWKGTRCGENLPDIYFLSKEIRVVQVSNRSIHRIAVSHFYHGGSGLAFHEFDLWKEEDCSIIQEYTLRAQDAIGKSASIASKKTREILTLSTLP